MTREEAISRIKNHMIIHKMNEPRAILIDEALAMAIKALEQEPCREADDYENEISDLYNHLDIVEYDKERLREEVTTLEEKLKGLSAELCDAISRQAAIDAMCALCNTGETLKENPWRDNPHIDAIIDALDNLPSVTPQPKTGHWIIEVWNNKEHHTCSNCQHVVTYEPCYHYCPYCGANMVEPKESEK